MSRLRFVILMLSCLLVITLWACSDSPTDEPNLEDEARRERLLRYGPNYDPNNAIVNQEHLFGMGYLFFERYNDIDGSTALEAMRRLGVTSYRVWLHFSYVLEDPTTPRTTNMARMQAHVAEAHALGFQLIGMNHTSYQPEGYFSIGKSRRINEDLPNSPYNQWLDAYEESWYTLVSHFPEIVYWEIDNEINNPDFMFIDGAKDQVLTTEEMAAIAADMLFRASRGIHRANPNAITVMGGLVDSRGLGLGSSWQGTQVGTMTEFLELLYDRIDSGEHGSLFYDDFFQVAAWHPYYYRSGPDAFFVAENQALYDIILRREGKDKKVFLSEFGWNPTVNGEDTVATWIEELYAVIASELPFVESLHYYILFNRDGGSHPIPHGLFIDPAHPDPTLAGQPRPMAFAYQRAAGGEGSLDFDFTPSRP